MIDMSAPMFADLTESPDFSLLPKLDQPDLDETGLSQAQRSWRRDGVLILPGFLPDDLMNAYIRHREPFGREGWQYADPYNQHRELRDLALYPPLMRQMRELIGAPMVLHLCLTGWVSTEREWHQDDYLNAPQVNCWYAAVWMALDDIDPDSGPFEYIPGSHRWPLLRRDKVRSFMTPDELKPIDHWAARSERVVTPAVNAEVARRNVPARKFIAKRGDVLIWHAALMHRGSKPRRSDLLRRAVICHYSGLHRQPGILEQARDANGEYYALFPRKLSLRRVAHAVRRRLQRIGGRLAG